MGIVYQDQTVYFRDMVTVEEAEALLEWLQLHPEPQVDLAECIHLHTAILQVLMAIQPKVLRWPEAGDLSPWLKGALGEDSN